MDKRVSTLLMHNPQKFKLTAYIFFVASFWENKDNITYKVLQSIETFGGNKQ